MEPARFFGRVFKIVFLFYFLCYNSVMEQPKKNFLNGRAGLISPEAIIFLAVLGIIGIAIETVWLFYGSGNWQSAVFILALVNILVIFLLALSGCLLFKETKQEKIALAKRRELLKKWQKANKELQRLDDAKSEFLSIASHQLRTPTTIIKGYISMMREGSFGRVPKVVQENLDKVSVATERLLNLIENLLDISRIEAGRLEFEIVPVDLAKIAEELKDEFKPKASAKKIAINAFYPADLPAASADKDKIKEVASNLVDNAVKYTKAGEVGLDLHQEGASVVFSVSDTGQGIGSEDLPRLFNKFVRGAGMAVGHPEGTGLGLYFARVVVENMGGRIWVESAGKGRGSKFSFSLPLADKRKASKIKFK